MARPVEWDYNMVKVAGIDMSIFLQAEIKRLQEASKAASKERQFLLKQSQEIARLRQSTQQVCETVLINKKHNFW